jgi:hypothetical protein
MTRRWLLILPLAACCRAADPAGEVLDLVADAAASLSAGNVAQFLKAFDPAMKGYAKLRENVTGLLTLGDVQSLIDPLENEGDDRRRVAQFQWTLRLQRGEQSTSWARREQVVKCKVEKQGGKWRIVELEPIEFFAPGS